MFYIPILASTSLSFLPDAAHNSIAVLSFTFLPFSHRLSSTCPGLLLHLAASSACVNSPLMALTISFVFILLFIYGVSRLGWLISFMLDFLYSSIKAFLNTGSNFFQVVYPPPTAINNSFSAVQPTLLSRRNFMNFLLTLINQKLYILTIRLLGTVTHVLLFLPLND